MKTKSELSFAGKTESGQIVIKGIYRCFETTGLPLDNIVSWIKENDFVPGWHDYFLEATNAGISPERTRSRMEEVIIDVYGKKYWDEIDHRLSKFIERS